MNRHDVTQSTGTVSPDVEYLARLTHDQLSPDGSHESARTWDRVLDRLDRRRRNLATTFAVACAVTIIPLAFLALRAPRRDRPLQVSFTGARLDDHGQITRTSEPTSSSLLHFSDGTEVELATDAAAQLVEVSAHGATLALEHGAAQFRVTPLPGAQWAVTAGPFRVQVKGTVFDLEWAPGPGMLHLQLRRGSVAVTGPLSSEPIVLRDRRDLLIDLPRGEVKIIDPETPVPEFAGPAADEPPALAPPPATATRGASKEHGKRATAAWQALFAAGKLDRILGEAEDAGFDASLAHRSNEDLAALADAARYRGRTDLARRTLLAQRNRFPGSLRAVEATFFLGRLDESTASSTQALAWYDSYLGASPHGRYAAEALGRKMLVVQKLKGTVEAQPIAEEYLRRYPEGAYLELARELVRR